MIDLFLSKPRPGTSLRERETEYARNWRERNRDKYNQTQRDWREKNKEHRRNYMAQYMRDRRKG